MSSARADGGSAYTVVARDEEMPDGGSSVVVPQGRDEELKLLVVSGPCPVRVKSTATCAAEVEEAVFGKLGIGTGDEADVLFFEPASRKYVLLDEGSFPDMPATAKIKVDRPERSKWCCSCSCCGSTDSAEMQPFSGHRAALQGTAARAPRPPACAAAERCPAARAAARCPCRRSTPSRPGPAILYCHLRVFFTLYIVI